MTTRAATTASYVELRPAAGLSQVVRAVWIQRTGAVAHVQRHLPTGGVELHFPVGARGRFLGPLTGPMLEVIPAGTTLVGLRFFPGAAPPPSQDLDCLVDVCLDLRELWGGLADRLSEQVAASPGPRAALALVQRNLVELYRRAQRGDVVVREAVGRLMPWQPVTISGLADHLSISASQLRRRSLHTVGLTPKALQRTLRFQGFLALAQAGAALGGGQRNADGLAGIAVDVGYADQAHLNRECLRLAGLTPRELLRGGTDRCLCGHDHTASFTPFLALRSTTQLRR